MSNEHVDELIDLYALGALEPSEQAAVDEHLDECARCSLKLEEAKRLVLLLAWTPDQHEPPPGLQRKVMRRIEQLQRLDGPGEQKWRQNIDLRRWFALPRPAWGLAFAALILLLGLGGRTVQLQQQLTAQQQQSAQQAQQLTAVQQQLSDAQQQRTEQTQQLTAQQQQISQLQTQVAEQQPVAQILSQPGARLVTLTAQDNPNEVQGYLLLKPDARTAFVSTAALAPLPADKTYQLWLIDEQPESVGLFETDPSGVGRVAVQAQKPLSEYQYIGITVEPAGGSPQPTTQPIVLNNL
jgi:anti-sigma-K factor RskA